MDIERGRTIEGWRPRRLGGGKGGRKTGEIRSSGRDETDNTKSYNRERKGSRERKRSRSKSRDRRRRSRSKGTFIKTLKLKIEFKFYIIC